jgi:hypothetical protein
MVFSRTAQVGAQLSPTNLLLVFFSLVALFLSWRWSRSDGALSARSHWVLGSAIFVLISSILGLPNAGIAWGLAFLFSGAIIFLFFAGFRSILIFPLIGALSLSALPLTPAWYGVALFEASPWQIKILFFFALAFFLAGYLKFVRRSALETEGIERWMWLVYSLGLAVITISSLYMVLYFGNSLGFSFQSPGWWYGIFPTGLAMILLWLNHRGTLSAPGGVTQIFERLEPKLISRLIWKLYTYFARFLNFLSKLLEGEGGILWALLALLLLVISLSLVENVGDFGF